VVRIKAVEKGDLIALCALAMLQVALLGLPDFS
jgi:hypothetical protein